MEENRTDDTQKVKRSFSAWLGELREFMKGRFSLDEDKAQRDEGVASVSKGVEFRGVNLWVLIFATMIASLGLNVNSAAVIIGAMLISPIMGRSWVSALRWASTISNCSRSRCATWR